MHELSIATAILEKLEAVAAERPGTRITKVGLRIGELSGVDPDALTFGFEVLVKDTPWDPLGLEIEFRCRRQQCPACGHSFEVKNYETACPRCGLAETICIAGEELDVAYVEVEEL